jgi:hypothetical protein
MYYRITPLLPHPTPPPPPIPTYPLHLTIFIAVSGLTLEVDTLLACELKPKQYIVLNYTPTQKHYFANLFPIFN